MTDSATVCGRERLLHHTLQPPFRQWIAIGTRTASKKKAPRGARHDGASRPERNVRVPAACRAGAGLGAGTFYFLRWRIRLRIRRFLRPTLRRPFPRRRLAMRSPRRTSIDEDEIPIRLGPGKPRIIVESPG